jgi:ATPase subunit of ABC transporter with duplicated ATPase domains
VSHDRRVLETVCEKLWVVDKGAAAPFDGGYRAWRAAIAGGWTVAGALEVEAGRLRGDGRRATGAATAVGSRSTRAAARPSSEVAVAEPTAPAMRIRRRDKLSKDAYRRQKQAVEGDLTRLHLRKNHLELAMADPSVAANFVEMRRVTSELADIEVALASAEDAWLELEERAP